MLGSALALATTALASAAPRVVDRYTVAWANPPTPEASESLPFGRPAPPKGPYAGNGDVSLLYSANGTKVGKYAAALDWQQWLYLSKNDMWGSDKTDYYPHLSAGRVGILLAPPALDAGAAPASAAGLNASVEMFPGNASIVHTLTSGSATVSATTRVLENNAVVTTLLCTAASGGACPVELLLSDTDENFFKVGQEAGAAPDGSLVWWRKENLHEALNGACESTTSLSNPPSRTISGSILTDCHVWLQTSAPATRTCLYSLWSAASLSAQMVPSRWSTARACGRSPTHPVSPRGTAHFRSKCPSQSADACDLCPIKLWHAL